jgi:hypothetical protein
MLAPGPDGGGAIRAGRPPLSSATIVRIRNISRVVFSTMNLKVTRSIPVAVSYFSIHSMAVPIFLYIINIK